MSRMRKNGECKKEREMENERMRENRNVNANANAGTKITTRELGDEQRATELMNTDNQVRTNNEGKRKRKNWKKEDRNE